MPPVFAIFNSFSLVMFHTIFMASVGQPPTPTSGPGKHFFSRLPIHLRPGTGSGFYQRVSVAVDHDLYGHRRSGLPRCALPAPFPELAHFVCIFVLFFFSDVLHVVHTHSICLNIGLFSEALCYGSLLYIHLTAKYRKLPFYLEAIPPVCRLFLGGWLPIYGRGRSAAALRRRSGAAWGMALGATGACCGLGEAFGVLPSGLSFRGNLQPGAPRLSNGCPAVRPL